jgi:tight adherence protein B
MNGLNLSNLQAGSWTAIGLLVAAVVIGTIALIFFIELIRQQVRERRVTKQLAAISKDNLQRTDGAESIFREESGLTPAWLQPIASKLPSVRDLDTLIEQAGMSWSSQTFLIMVGGFSIAFGGAFGLAFGNPVALVAGGVGGGMLPYWFVRGKREKRMRAFEELLPEAIDLLGRALRAGHPLSSGLRMIAEEMKDPIAGEFRRVFEEQRFGLNMEDSLLGMADRIPLVDVRIFVTAVLIQREVGGNLAEILDKLSYVIRQRFSIMRQVRTFTAQGRMSGYVLGGLPIFLGLVLFTINRDDMLAFIVDPTGRLLMMVAAALQISGYLWISRIVKIEV